MTADYFECGRSGSRRDDHYKSPEQIANLYGRYALPRKRVSVTKTFLFIAAVVAIVLAALTPCKTGAQTYTLTTPNGSMTQPLLPGGGEALEVRYRNGQNPDRWGLASLQQGSPIPFYSWTVDAPGKTLLVGGLFGARQTGPGSFLLADANDWKLPARRNGVDLWPTSASLHRILPSDTLYARLVPADDPWEFRYLSKITLEQRQLALHVMAFDENRIARWPWLGRVLSWYRYDASSVNPATPAGQRNCGWLLVPSNFMVRWPHYPAGIQAIQHWYGIGTRSAVAGENLTNEHYGAAAAWIGLGLRNNDHVALTVGLYLLRHKVAYGLIDCDDTSHLDWGLWRNEKGDLARGTTGTRPSRAKEYDRDLAMAHALGLTAEEPLLGRAAMLRMGSLLRAQWAWSGSGGARHLGHYLENLRDWYIVTGDDRFRARADKEIVHAMLLVGSRSYFVDDPAHEKVSGGEGVCALAACRWWTAHGAGSPQIQAKLDAMLAWYEAKLHSGGQTAYYAVVNADGTVTWQANAGFGALNWLHIPGLSQPIREKIESALFTRYANTPTCDAAFGGEGPGWEKWVPWLVRWGATSE